MKLVNLRFLPSIISRNDWFLVGVITVGIPICLALWFFDPLKARISDLIGPLIGGIISVSVILASIFQYLASVFKQEKYLSYFIYALTLILLSVVFGICSYLMHQLFYLSAYSLTAGILLFLDEVRGIIFERNVGATLLDTATQKARREKFPHLGERSLIADKVFEGCLRADKGNTLLACCEFVQDGRILARKIIRECEYAIYVSADRPHTVVEAELCNCPCKIYCIDCFTNLYGFGEFKQADRFSNSYTLNPPTVRELHTVLREIRRRIVSNIICGGKSWYQLNKTEQKRVETELASGEATVERMKNVWIIYDSISSLSAVFDVEALLKFLIHDNTVDMTIGRNTLLLVKTGTLDQATTSRVESICEQIMNVKMESGKLDIHICQTTDTAATKHFSIGL